MKLTQSDRNALGLVDYVDNSVQMTSDELKNIRKTLKLTQDSLAKLIGVTRYWILRCEQGKKQMSYIHAMALRLLIDLPEVQRPKWINVPKRKNRTKEDVQDAIEDAIFNNDKEMLAYFRKNGHEITTT